MKKLLLLIIICISLTGCKKESVEKKKVNEYEASEVCRLVTRDEIDGDIYISESVVYLDYDVDLFVKSAIYQSISNLSDVSSYTYEAYEYIKELYSDVDGVEVTYYETKDNLVLEIKYNYDIISLESIRDHLGGLLDQNSILANADSLPIKVDAFKDIELNEYDCEVK